MKSKKEVKKEVFISVTLNDNNEVVLFVLKEGVDGNAIIISPKAAKDMLLYADMLNIIRDASVIKITDDIKTMKSIEISINGTGSDKLISNEIDKKQWVFLTTLAKDLGIKKSETVSNIAKEFKIKLAEETFDTKHDLKNEINVYADIYTKLNEIKKKDALEEVKKNLWKKQLEYVETGEDKKRKLRTLLKTYSQSC